MYFLVGLMIFVTLILGLNFCFLLIGGPPWKRGREFSPVQIGLRSYSVERFTVGISTSVLGAGWLLTWIYFIITKWASFITQIELLWLHVTLQFIVSAGLITSGIAIFKQWQKSNLIFLSSMGLLLISVFIALLLYGQRGLGDVMFMYLLAAWTLVAGGIFTTGVFFLDKLTHQSNDLKDLEK